MGVSGRGSDAAGGPHPAAAGRCRAFLAQCRTAEGAFPYTPGAAPRPEPTVLAVAAGEPLPAAWIAALPPQWGLMLLPAVAGAQAPAICAPILAWLLQSRSLPVEDVEGFDATIPGWSWVEGTAAWVEPTAWAVLSLCRCPPLPGIGAVDREARAAEGVRLLLDRQCADGGWNYGNPRVLGQELVSAPASTGWAALALIAARQAGHAVPPDALARADAALDLALARPGLSSLALAALARRAGGGDAAPFMERLLPRISPEEGAGGRADWTALCAMALDGIFL